MVYYETQFVFKHILRQYHDRHDEVKISYYLLMGNVSPLTSPRNAQEVICMSSFRGNNIPNTDAI